MDDTLISKNINKSYASLNQLFDHDNQILQKYDINKYLKIFDANFNIFKANVSHFAIG